MPLVSVIIPVYNEEKTIEEIVKVIDSINIDKEVIVIDNGSTDKSREILKGLLRLPNVKLFFYDKNIGKGGAFKAGLRHACGDIVIIQDADMEYDPRDYYQLIQPIIDNRADFTLGIRFAGGYRGLFLHRLGNRFLTGLFNILYGCRLNDIYTCYKVCKREVFNKFNLRSDDFSIDQEIVVRALEEKLRICEVPVSYRPRSYSEGKKIRFADAFRIARNMLRLRFVRR